MNTNANNENKLNIKLTNKIDLFFHEHKAEKFLPLLKIINLLEIITFDYMSFDYSQEEGKIFKQVYKYCYENFYTSFTSVKAHNFKVFYKLISNYRKSLPVGGVILVNKEKEFLCVVNKHDEMNFPMGKQDFADEGSLKITALRELGEEAGIWLTEKEFEKYDKYIEYRCQYYGRKTKRFQLYIIEDFDKDRVDLNHTRRGEITGLVWVKPHQVVQVVNMENKSNIPKNKLLHNLNSKGVFYMSWFIRKIIPQSRTQWNPFETFGSEDSSKAEVYKDLCVLKEPYFAARNFNLSKH